MNQMARKCFYSIFLISLFIFISCNFLGENLQEHKTDDESVGVKICLNFGIADKLCHQTILRQNIN